MSVTHVIAALLAAAPLAGCMPMSDSRPQSPADLNIPDLRASFSPHGQATLDRLAQDDTQRLCSEAAATQKSLPRDLAGKIEGENARSIKWPANGYLGDWREGEKIAQSGVGKQFNDAPGVPSGGNCYACHQLAAQELSYGTIGPSLYRYAAARAAMPRAELERYTYGKIYDAEAYVACTNMPRFGAKGILSEEQIRNVAALLLDPSSPVNR